MALFTVHMYCASTKDVIGCIHLLDKLPQKLSTDFQEHFSALQFIDSEQIIIKIKQKLCSSTHQFSLIK